MILARERDPGGGLPRGEDHLFEMYGVSVAMATETPYI
jgi:hypothetical protein